MTSSIPQKATTDRHLRVEISALREMYYKNEIKINWLSKHHQLSDVLTKKRFLSQFDQSTTRR